MLPSTSGDHAAAPRGRAGVVVWLVSYPKSGNTWLRAFMLNLLEDGDEPVTLDALAKIRYASGRALIDEYAGVETSELGDEEIIDLRHRVYDLIGEQARARGETILFRYHEAFFHTPGGAPLISRRAASGVVYLVRNPLDVVVSFAHHFACTVDEAIERLGDPQHRIFDSRDRLHWLPPQRYGTWSDHVASWLDESGLRLIAVRYEDLMRDAETMFTKVAEFAGLPTDPRRIAKAIGFSRFEELRRQELVHGFDERNPAARSFFRKGAVDGWRPVLTATQVQRVIGTHRTMMRRFGYVDDDGEVVLQPSVGR